MGGVWLGKVGEGVRWLGGVWSVSLGGVIEGLKIGN